jgi:hypothetical protein
MKVKLNMTLNRIAAEVVCVEKGVTRYIGNTSIMSPSKSSSLLRDSKHSKQSSKRWLMGLTPAVGESFSMDNCPLNEQGSHDFIV